MPPEYPTRPWCRADLLLAYAIMTTGGNVFVIPAGFAGSDVVDDRLEKENLRLADPRETVGTLTKLNDRPVIASLTGSCPPSPHAPVPSSRVYAHCPSTTTHRGSGALECMILQGGVGACNDIAKAAQRES